MIKRIIYFTTIALCSIMFSSCDSEENIEHSGLEIDVPGNHLIEFKPDRKTFDKNPLSGWVIYTGLGDGLSDTFWEDYDNFQSTAGRINVSDYATTLFIRGAWSNFNPEEGKYAWHDDVNTIPAQRFKSLVEGAYERGLKLAFSFIVDSRDKHYEFTPQYVKNSEGVDGYITRTGVSTDVWSPYPDNKVFQKHYERFIKDFAAEFNDAQTVEFMSGTGLGKWGESHTMLYSTGDDTPRNGVFDWVTSLYAKHFTDVPVVINYHRWIFTGRTWDGSNYDPETEQLLASAIDKGFSLRHDAFGMKTYYSTWERNFAERYKFVRPIIAEGGWVRGSHGNSILGDGYKNYAEVRRGEFDEAKGAHANMMDLRYSSSGYGETFSWFNDAYNLVEEFINEGSYKLYPSIISFPKKIKANASFTIGHRWNNFGWGYFPTNIPQWHDKYKIAFALLDKQTDKPVKIFIDAKSDLSKCTKGFPQNYILKSTAVNIPKGQYTWAVGIVNTKLNNSIEVKISSKGDFTKDSWLKIDNVTIE